MSYGIGPENGSGIKVGPLGNGYGYRIGNRVSIDTYANPQSALAAARRPQQVVAYRRLSPMPQTHEISQAVRLHHVITRHSVQRALANSVVECDQILAEHERRAS